MVGLRESLLTRCRYSERKHDCGKDCENCDAADGETRGRSGITGRAGRAVRAVRAGRVALARIDCVLGGVGDAVFVIWARTDGKGSEGFGEARDVSLTLGRS